MNYELKVFSIFDRVADSYNTPFFLANDALAVRTFTDLVNDPSSSIFRHSGDFALFSLGSFYPSTGTFNLSEPQFIVNASSLVRDVQVQIPQVKEGGN